MRKTRYCVLMSINDEYFGSKIIKAKDEVDCMNKFLSFMVKNEITFNTSVDIEIETLE